LDEILGLLNKLMQLPKSQPFHTSTTQNPPSVVGTPLGRPTDLQSIKNRLDSKQYQRPEAVLADIQLIFSNAMKAYPKENTIYQSALELLQVFQQLTKTLINQKTQALLSQQAQTPPRPPLGQIPSPYKTSPFLQQYGHMLQQQPPESLLALPEKIKRICDSLEKLKDSQGRQIAELFIDLPSREDYPDYYQIIKQPIAINDFRKKNYPSASHFITDFITLVNNAQTYNMPNSFVYHDSKQLYNEFVRNASKYFPGIPVPPNKDMQERAMKKSNKKRGKGRRRKDEEEFDSDDSEISEEEMNLDDDVDEGTLALKRKFELEDLRRSKRAKATPTKEGPTDSEQQLEEIIGADDDEDSMLRPVIQKVESIIPEDDGTAKKIVEKILGDRPKKNEDGSPSDQFEYFVKWKGKAYIHCEWIDASVILAESHGKTKLNRYHQGKLAKQAGPGSEETAPVDESEYFPDEYCEVERIIASKESQDKEGKTVTKYLVKWSGLGYAECSWELPEVFKDDEKVAEYKTFNTPPATLDQTMHQKKKWIKMEKSPDFKGGNQLRPYQLEGMNWLTFNWYENRGSILADEMGLGKTVQSISFLNYLFKYEGMRGPFLVIAPLSTLGHWYREFEEWTEMNVVLYQGHKSHREIARQYEWYYLDAKGEPSLRTMYKFHALVTTYEMIMSVDWQELGKIKWKVIVVDEAQRLKNQNSRLLENLRLFHADHRVLLTGTPLQNNTQELWSLLNYIEPAKFASLPGFMAEFGQLENSEQVGKLHQILRPHLLRRMKEDVEKSIPPKEETLIEVELTTTQKAYYKAVLEKNRDFLNKGCVGKNVPNLINLFMQLRKICNHPFLLGGVEEKEHAKAGALPEYYKNFVNASGKMVLLDKLLPKLKAQGHKVLIFSQMVRVLDLLETYMKFKGHLFERLDGQVRRNERQASIDRFCKPGSDRFVFLLCTRAGGLGINLTAADTVIIYDSDWNPQNDIQAQARCHRIGQTQEVKVYRLITANSYERRMFERSSKKLGLDQAVLHDMGAPKDTASLEKTKSTLDKKEIDDLLKFGAYDLFREESKEKERQFVESDIDQILDRSSKVVWNEATAKIMGGNSSFSKATFRSSNTDDVEFDDPNFWDKVMGEEKTSEKLLERLQRTEALATIEQRQEFVRDMEQFVSDVLTALKDGKYEEVSKTRNTLMKVFEVIKRSLSAFTDAQQKQILKWQIEVTKPRRERKTRYGEGYEPLTGRRRDFFTGEGTEAWTEKQRKKFHYVFMSLGPTRFKEIAKKTNIHKSMDELRDYSVEFLRQCAAHCEDKDRIWFIDCLEEILGDVLPEDIELLPDPRWVEYVKRRLKGWVRQLRQINILRELFKNGIDEFEPPKVNKPLTSWWKMEEDRSLLIGVWRHGLGYFDEIKNDPLLTFVNHKAEIEAAEKAEKDKLEKAKTEEGSASTEVKSEAPSTEVKAEIQPETKIETKQEEVKEEKMEEAKSDEVKTEVAPSTKSESEETKSEGGDSMEISEKKEEKEEKDDDDKFLDKEDDEDFDEEDQPVGPKTETPSTTPIKISTKITLRLPTGWPSAKTLEAHVKYLIDTIRRLDNTVEKAKFRQFREDERYGRRKRGKEDRERDWTKREQIDFRNALMIYGAGPWAVIKTKANLHKTVEQIDEFFQIVIEQAKQQATKPIGKGTKEEEDGEKEDDANDSMQADEAQELEGEKKDGSQPKSETPSKNILQNVDFKLAPISTTMARKLLRRIKMMDDIRNNMLKNPEIDEKLKKAKSFDMPNWWGYNNDKMLLEYVAKFGIGYNQDWEEFLNDQECPLFKNIHGKVEHKKTKHKFLLQFLTERPVVSRLEYICLVVMEAQAYSEGVYGIPTFIYSTRSYKDGRKSDDGFQDPERIKSGSRSVIRDVPRDDEGKPILPYQIKGITILNLGSIVWDRPAFSSRNYIWPVGFKSQRRLPSVKRSGEYVIYTSEIIDGGNAPIFQVTPADDSNLVMKHTTSSGVWCEMLKLIKKKPTVSVSGPEMFGFSDNTIKMLIQELPNARKCKSYGWKEYDGSTPAASSNPGSPSAQVSEEGASEVSTTPMKTTRLSDANLNQSQNDSMEVEARNPANGSESSSSESEDIDAD